MRFRFCCTCDDDDEKKVKIEEPSSSTVFPTTITQQPQQTEPVQLDKRTEVSVVESSTSSAPTKEKQPNIQVPKREEPSPAKFEEQQSTVPAFKTQTEKLSPARNQEEQSIAPETREQLLKIELMNQLLRLMEDKKAPEKAFPPQLPEVPMHNLRTPTTTENSESNMTFNSSIGNEEVTLTQVLPGMFKGKYRGSSFWAISYGEIYYESEDYSEYEKEAIATIYSRVIRGMKNGKETMQPTTTENSASNMTFNSSIGNEKVTLTQVRPRMYQGTYRGSSFWAISYGEIYYESEDLSEYEKEAIATIYSRVIQGLKNGTFVCVKPNHLRSTFNGKDFSLIHGRIVETDEPLDDYEKQIILNNLEQAMMGMKRDVLGKQQGMLGMQMGKASMALPTPPERSNNSESNITINSSIGDEKVTFTQIAPGMYQGTYCGSLFWVKPSGKIIYEPGYSEYEKEAIATIYSKAMEKFKKR